MGEGHNFQITLPKPFALSGPCASSREGSTAEKWAAQSSSQSCSWASEVQMLKPPKQAYSTKFKKQEFSGMGVSISPQLSFQTSVYILLTLGTSTVLKWSISYFCLASLHLSRMALGAKKYRKWELKCNCTYCRWSRSFSEKMLSQKNHSKGSVLVIKKGIKQLQITGYFQVFSRLGQITWSPWKRASRLPCHFTTVFACLFMRISLLQIAF